MPELPDTEADLPLSDDTEKAGGKNAPSRRAEAKANPAASELPSFGEDEAFDPEIGTEAERDLVRPATRKPSIVGTFFLLILTAIVGVATGFILVMLL